MKSFLMLQAFLPGRSWRKIRDRSFWAMF